MPIILLLTAAALAFAWRGYVRSVETHDHESQLLAAAAAVDAERFLANRIEMLQAISTAPVFSVGDLNAMNTYLTDVVSASGFSEIGWIDTRGYAQTVGGAAPLSAPLFIGDRPHIARALETQAPVVGNAQISRVSQEPTVNVVVPVRREGRVVALITGAVRLNGQKITDLRFGNVDDLRVVDGNGSLVVIAGQGGLRELRDVRSWPGYERIRQEQAGILHANEGLLGESDRLIAFAAVAGSDWVVLVDRPQSAVYADASGTLRTELGIAVIFAASSLLLVAWAAIRLDAGAERFVLFVDTLTHDIGTPLTVIRASAGRLQRAVRGDPTLLSSVTEVDRAGRRIERMIQGLADLLGPTQRPAITRTELDLVQLVRDMVAECELRTGRTIQHTAGASTIIGEWDGLRLERLVDNMLSNAIKYSPPTSEVLVGLSTEQTPAGRCVDIEVRDFGIGIPQSEVDSIWKRFARGSNTGSVPGKGVGLASVRQIAEEHHGTVSIASTEGQGTTVSVRLPSPEDEAPDASDEASALAEPSSTTRG